jgi:hypothetical protein
MMKVDFIKLHFLPEKKLSEMLQFLITLYHGGNKGNSKNSTY